MAAWMQTLLCLALLCTAAVSRVEDIDADELYETINGNTDHWYIMFYHANCVYCAELAPVFTRASTLVPSKIRFGIVDLTAADTELKEELGITEFPTLSIYVHPYKQKGANQPGWRSDSEDRALQMVAFIQAVVAANVPPSQDPFKQLDAHEADEL